MSGTRGSAYGVTIIGPSGTSVYLNIETSENDQDESTGAFAPENDNWSKTNRTAGHEIPSPADRTCKTSGLTLWNYSLNVYVIDKTTNENLFKLADESGPCSVNTYYKHKIMDLTKAECSREGGQKDNVCHWNLSFQEVRN